MDPVGGQATSNPLFGSPVHKLQGPSCVLFKELPDLVAGMPDPIGRGPAWSVGPGDSKLQQPLGFLCCGSYHSWLAFCGLNIHTDQQDYTATSTCEPCPMGTPQGSCKLQCGMPDNSGGSWHWQNGEADTLTPLILGFHQGSGTLSSCNGPSRPTYVHDSISGAS